MFSNDITCYGGYFQIDTNQQLPWLKEIQKAHGSVEVTSLMQADAINADGVYTVGKLARKTTDTSSSVMCFITSL